jgi:glutathione S-transferase
MDRLTLYGSFTSSSSYKPMLYLALARLPFSFRTVNLKTGVQKTPEYLAVNRWGVVPSLRHRGLTILQSNVILDYLAHETGHFEGRTEQQRWQAREWLSWEADHITYVAKVRGVVLLFLSPEAVVSLFEIFRFEELFYVYAGVTLVVGFYLTYAGFSRRL